VIAVFATSIAFFVSIVGLVKARSLLVCHRLSSSKM
jgi:hypothetical protein